MKTIREHSRRHKSSNAQGEIFRFFMLTRRQRCSQTESDSHRWKVTGFLSVSLPHPPSLFSPSSSSLFLFALSCVLIIAAALSAADLISSLRFIVLHFFSLPFPYLVSPSIFFFPLLYSQRGNWNSFLQSICCHSNACTSAMLCSSSVFRPISTPFPSLHPLNLPHPSPLHTYTHTHKYYSHSCPVSKLRNSQCIVGLDSCICVCAMWACVQRWHCKVKRTEAGLVHNKTWSMDAL